VVEPIWRVELDFTGVELDLRGNGVRAKKFRWGALDLGGRVEEEWASGRGGRAVVMCVNF